MSSQKSFETPAMMEIKKLFSQYVTPNNSNKIFDNSYVIDDSENGSVRYSYSKDGVKLNILDVMDII